MAAGDRIQSSNDRVVSQLTKTNTAITKGQVLCFDTDGYAPATITLRAAATGYLYKLMVALETKAAVAATQVAFKGLEDGVVEITKVAGTIGKGQYVAVSATAGSVQAWVAPDCPRDTFGWE